MEECVMEGSPHGINYQAFRPVIMGRRGMVCSAHPLASQAGISILEKGGNAVDAATAVGAVLNVVEPHMSGIGGDGFLMIYDKSRQFVTVANATGAAPYMATRERYLPKGIPFKGSLSVSVPGLLKGWVEAHQRYGKMNLNDVFSAAIELADYGFPVTHKLSSAIMTDSLLRQFPSSSAIFTRDGVPLGPGDILYQHDLAKTLYKIATDGSDIFYRGEIADAIVNFVNKNGGILSLKDLRDCTLRWEDPITTTYRGHTVFEAPPNSSGHVLLQELNLMENFDMSVLGCNTSAAIHAMVEAKKLAFADRETYLADPEFIDVPIQGLLSKEYAKERVALIDLERASTNVRSGLPRNHQGVNDDNGVSISFSKPPEEDTTCFCVVDQWGNAVVQLQSLQSGFGSSLIVDGTGILLNNRMTYWHLEKDHVDCLQPGKRVRHTMNPVMIFDSLNDNQELVLACGTPGADTQVQTNLQVISHVLDFGMNVVEAVEAPRWRHMQNPTESTYPHTSDDVLQVEGRFTQDVMNGLSERGHDLDIMGNWEAAGSEMMIQVDLKTGGLYGAADPRRDGYALGL